jgi:hypothetical protein
LYQRDKDTKCWAKLKLNLDGSVGESECTDCPSNTNPEPYVQVPTDPTQPSSGMVDGNGCAIGLPTLPNVRPPTPCAKIKAQREDEGFSKRIDTLQGKTGLTKETGYIQKWGGSYEYQSNASATADARALHLPEVASNAWIKAFMHTHINDIPNTEYKGIKMFSPADASYLMDLVQNAQTNGYSLSDPYGVMVTSTGNYQIRFTGNKFQIKTFSTTEADTHSIMFGKAMEKFIDKPKQLELNFLKYIQKEMLLYGITLYRMNTDGTTTEIKLNADKTDTIENNCPI